MSKSSLERWLHGPLVALALLYVLFEEWLWRRCVTWLRRLIARAHLAVLERWIGRAPSYVALALLLIPFAALLPFKLLGVLAIAHGYPVGGLLAVIAAKVTGTALFAWLFELTEPALMRVPWMARVRRWVDDVRARAHAWLATQPSYRHARVLFARLRRPGALRRQVHAVYRLHLWRKMRAQRARRAAAH